MASIAAGVFGGVGLLLLADRLHNCLLWAAVQGSRIRAQTRYGREPGPRSLAAPLLLLLVALGLWSLR